MTIDRAKITVLTCWAAFRQATGLNLQQDDLIPIQLK
jgi:hypothetical protein